MINHLDNYKRLVKDWYFILRDPDSRKEELQEIDNKLSVCWKKMSTIEHYEANKFVKELKKK